MSSRKGGIVRVNKRQSGYAVIDTYFLNDERLSWKAKGLLAYLLSKPDNWRVYVADLVKRSKDGRDSVYSTLRELEAAGYIERERIKGEDGRFTHIETVVYEYPITPEPPFTENPEVAAELSAPSPHTENPDVEKSDTDNPTQVINDLNNNDFKRMNEKSADQILQTLADELRKIRVNEAGSLYDFHFEEIYAMLTRRFPDRLEPRTIERAAEIYFYKTVDNRTLEPKLIVHSPPGLFCDAYKDALAEDEAAKWRRAGG